MIANLITKIIDFFYKPFASFVPRQLFRYACCGGGNMVLDWILYFVTYNFLLQKRFTDLGFVVVSPHIATLCIVFPITLLTGFWLNKHITFRQSSLAGTSQLVRYLLVVMLNLAINYFGLKLCVEVWHWYPTPSKVVITLLTVAVSFFGQKYFSFRK